MRQDLGPHTVDFNPMPVSLENVRGKIPFPGTDHAIEVSYKHEAGTSTWTLVSDILFNVRMNGSMSSASKKFEYGVSH